MLRLLGPQATVPALHMNSNPLLTRHNGLVRHARLRMKLTGNTMPSDLKLEMPSFDLPVDGTGELPMQEATPTR